MKISIEEATADRRKPKGGWNNELDIKRARSLLTLVKEIQFDPEAEKRCFNWLYRLGLDIETSMGRIKKRWTDLDDDMCGGIRQRMIAFYCGQPKKAGADSSGLRHGNDFEPEAKPGVKTIQGLSYRIGSDIEPKNVDWLWPNRFPRGKVSMLAGFPDQGKSQIMLNIAATITRGGEWPCGEGEAEKGAVVILSSEDDADDTLVPRLIAAGADMNQVVIVDSMVKEVDPQTGKKRRVVNIEDDLGRLAAILHAERANGRDVKAIILDPLNAYFGGAKKADSHKASEMRALLTPISEWCARHKIAVLVISHFNKGGNSHALYRVTDSAAITAACRAVWFAFKIEGIERWAMVPGKKNIGPKVGGIEYTIEAVDIGRKGIDAQPRIVWGDRSTMTPDEAFGGGRGRPVDPTAASKEAEDLVVKMLEAKGEVNFKKLKDKAALLGISESTLHNARRKLHLDSEQRGFGKDKTAIWTIGIAPDEFEGHDEFDFEGGEEPSPA